MGLIVLGHGEDRNHRYAAGLALLPACALVYRSKVGVHISGISAAAGDFLSRRRNFTQSVRVVRDISQYNKDMHSAVKREIFRGGQSHLGRCDTLDGGVVCEVREHNGSVERAGASEALDKVVRLLEGYTHCRKDNGELLVIAEHLCLTRYLRREVCVGQTGCREYRQFLTSDKSVQSVDSGDTGLDELLGIASGCRIHRQAVDIHSLLGDYLGAAVYGSAESVKDAAEHIGRNAELHLPAGEAHLAVGEVDSSGIFKQLNKCVRAVYFEHAAAAGLAVCKLNFAELVILNSLDLAHEHKRSRNLLNSSVFFRHQ